MAMCKLSQDIIYYYYRYNLFSKVFDCVLIGIIDLASDWATYVSSQLTGWESLHELWLTKFPGPLHIVFYEVLVRDTRHTLQGILDFLSYNVTEVSIYNNSFSKNWE